MFKSIINFFYPPMKEEAPITKIKPVKTTSVKKENPVQAPPNLLEEIIEKKKTLRKVTPKPAYIREDPFTTFLENFRKKINGED